MTHHGNDSGRHLPPEDPDRLPQDLRRELASTLGRHLSQLLDAQGFGEEDVQADFDAERRRARLPALSDPPSAPS